MLETYSNIKKFRNQYGWNQQELADKMGYTDKSMIAKIESGKVDLPQSKILKFAEVFHVSPGTLMGLDGCVNDLIADDDVLIEAVKDLDREQKDYLIRIAQMFSEKK